MLIPIHGKSGVIGHAIVDDADAPELLEHRWNLNANGYPVTHRRSGFYRHTKTLMHRMILAAPSGVVVDHIDRNQLNNSRSNLRICTRSENNKNRTGNGAVSGYRGVSRGHHGGWVARIFHNWKQHHLGTFDTKEEAWAARRAAEINLRGQFAPIA